MIISRTSCRHLLATRLASSQWKRFINSAIKLMTVLGTAIPGMGQTRPNLSQRHSHRKVGPHTKKLAKTPVRFGSTAARSSGGLLALAHMINLEGGSGLAEVVNTWAKRSHVHCKVVGLMKCARLSNGSPNGQRLLLQPLQLDELGWCIARCPLPSAIASLAVALCHVYGCHSSSESQANRFLVILKTRLKSGRATAATAAAAGSEW